MSIRIMARKFVCASDVRSAASKRLLLRVLLHWDKFCIENNISKLVVIIRVSWKLSICILATISRCQHQINVEMCQFISFAMISINVLLLGHIFPRPTTIYRRTINAKRTDSFAKTGELNRVAEFVAKSTLMYTRNKVQNRIGAYLRVGSHFCAFYVDTSLLKLNFLVRILYPCRG